MRRCEAPASGGAGYDTILKKNMYSKYMRRFLVTEIY